MMMVAGTTTVRCALVVAVLSPAGVAGLLQAQKGPLPPAEAVLAKPRRVLEEMSSYVQALQAEMNATAAKQMQATAAQKAQHEKELGAQQAEIVGAQADIARVRALIVAQQKRNMDVRQKAQLLEQECKQLASHARAIRLNFTTAADVLDSAASAAEEKLRNAPELEVLAELAAEDAAQRAKLNTESRYAAITGVGALLQTSSMRFPKNTTDNAKELVQNLLASLTSVSQEQNASEALLKAHFEEAFRAGTEKLAALRDQKAQLDEELRSETDIGDRLVTAMKHLTGVRDKMWEQEQAMKMFAQRMGDRPLPAAEVELKAMKTVNVTSADMKVKVPASEVKSKATETVKVTNAGKKVKLPEREVAFMTVPKKNATNAGKKGKPPKGELALTKVTKKNAAKAGKKAQSTKRAKHLSRRK